MKRKNEEMQGELSNLRQLYDFLRSRPEHEALGFLKQIRRDAPNTTPTQRIQELADYARADESSYASSSKTVSEPGSSLFSLTLPPIRVALDSPGSESS